jgi:hypothetical protein
LIDCSIAPCVTAAPTGRRPRQLRSPAPGPFWREWQGTTHHVTIVNDGFVWNGHTHRSLSSIARAITGTKWNGPRFFGMREVNGRAAETRRGR